jgi:hypothetical protein
MKEIFYVVVKLELGIIEIFHIMMIIYQEKKFFVIYLYYILNLVKFNVWLYFY